MAIERHIIELSARDTLSPALKKVGDNAQDAGRKAEDAGRRATRSTQDWGRAASALGAGLGTLAGVAIKLGNDSEQVQVRLEQSIENTGAAYEDLADQIQDAADASLDLAFDDEDALTAIQRLTDATGNAETAINDLALAQDIARGRGISLAAATDIVIAAETGRVQSLRRMGIVLDENATKEDYLAALQQRYAGQAEAYASTNAATWDRVGNTIENKLEELGGALADFQGPLIALGAGAQVIGPLGDAFDALGGKARAASLGTAALNLAMGPVGLVAVAAAAAGGIYYLTQRESDHERQTRLLTEATDDYTRSIQENTTALVEAGTYDIAGSTQQYLETIIANGAVAQQRIDGLREAEFFLSQEVVAGQENRWAALDTLDDYTKAVLAAADADMNGSLSSAEFANAIAMLSSGFEATGDEALALTNAVNAVTQATANPDLYGQDIAQEQLRILQELGGGYIDVNEAIRQLNALPLDPQFNKALQEQKKSLYETTDAYKYATTEWKASVPVITSATDAIEDNAEAVEYTATAYSGSWPVIEQYTGSVGKAVGVTQDMSGAAVQAGADMSYLSDQILDLAEAVIDRNPADILDRTFGAIVGNTNAMVGSIDTAREWADALIAPVGTYSTLDDLLASNRISIDQYNAAQQAQIDITEDYNRALIASQDIQATQAPLIAEQAEATADYLEYVSGLTAEEQALKLAWQDQDISARANDILDMAANFGDMTDAQKEAFEATVEGAAAADPMLAGILEQMGVISYGANGEIIVNTQEGETAIGSLNDSIDQLILRLDPTYIAKMDTEDMGATERAGLYAELFSYGLSSYTSKLDADPAPFWEEVNAIPYTVATRYVDVAYRSIGPTPYALGGIVGDMDAAANGRLSGGGMTLVGEHGPELVSLPGGSLVTPNHATMYRDEARGMGGVTITGEFHFYGVQNPDQFVRELRRSATTLERR